MTIRRWLWVVIGLLCWAALVVLWATSPTNCQVPDHGRVVCGQTGGAR